MILKHYAPTALSDVMRNVIKSVSATAALVKRVLSRLEDRAISHKAHYAKWGKLCLPLAFYPALTYAGSTKRTHNWRVPCLGP